MQVFLLQLLATVRKFLVPVRHEGYLFIGISLVFSFIGAFLSAHLFWIFLFLTVWFLFFFRDPSRVTPLDDQLVISSADGVVSAVGFVIAPPELGMGSVEMIRISVFMDIFSCHVNRIPVQGKIIHKAYIKGKFFNADLDKSSIHNERNSLVVETLHGKIGIIQIAGMIARRIVCWKDLGSQVVAGERFGLIMFGSRVDVFLPTHAQTRVSVGQLAVAGETIIADFREQSSPIPPVRVS